MADIWTGTADVENGETLVTVAAGDPLSFANCSPGSLVLIDGAAYFVDARVSTLSFNLTRAYAGTTDTGVGMEMSPVSPETTNLVNLLSVVARTQSQLNIFDKNSQGLFFNLLGVTGSADPGPGNMAVNNADPASITQVYFDYLDANDAHYSVAGLLATIGQNTRLRIRSLNSAAYVELQVLSALADQTGYYAGEVAYVDHDGVIGDGEPVSVNWSVDGQSLDVDASGTFAGRNAYDDEAGGFRYLSNDGDGAELTGGVLFIKDSATTGDWGPGIPLRGEQGNRGWSPRLAVASDGDRRVLQLAGYVGGEGVEPTVGVGQYIAVGGLDPDIADGIDIRGPQGVAGNDGTNGTNGTNGADGVDGTDPGVLFNWDDGTTDSDPGAGNIRGSSGDLSAATMLFVSKTNRAGDDISVFLAGLADSTNPVKGSLTLTRTGGNAQAIFDVTGLTDATDYVKIAVSNPAGATGFIDADAVSLQFARSGDQGSADEIGIASSINASPEVTAPDVATKFAITDPVNGDVLSWLTLGTLSEFVSPPAASVDAKSANYTVLAADAGKALVVSAAVAARTITLLPAATAGNGFQITVKKSDSSVNTVTIDGDGSETIEGAATLVLRNQNDGVQLVCDGSSWVVKAVAGDTLNGNGSVTTTTLATTTTITGIAATTKEIVVDFSGLQPTANSTILFQLGAAGALVATGYVGTGTRFSVSAVATVLQSNGLVIYTAASTEIATGRIVASLLDAATNLWVMTFVGTSSTNASFNAASKITLSGVPDRVAFVANSGNLTAGGKINVRQHK